MSFETLTLTAIGSLIHKEFRTNNQKSKMRDVHWIVALTFLLVGEICRISLVLILWKDGQRRKSIAGSMSCKDRLGNKEDVGEERGMSVVSTSLIALGCITICATPVPQYWKFNGLMHYAVKSQSPVPIINPIMLAIDIISYLILLCPLLSIIKKPKITLPR
jgi:hypothetical protein